MSPPAARAPSNKGLNGARAGRRGRRRSPYGTLERRQLDLATGTIRLEPGTTKNDDGRVVYMPPDLKALVAAQVERVRALERQTGRIVPYLFPHLSGRLRGQRIRDFRKAWATAREKGALLGACVTTFGEGPSATW